MHLNISDTFVCQTRQSFNKCEKVGCFTVAVLLYAILLQLFIKGSIDVWWNVRAPGLFVHEEFLKGTR